MRLLFFPSWGVARSDGVDLYGMSATDGSPAKCTVALSLGVRGLYLLVISNVWDQAHQSSELHKSSESEITYTRYSHWTCNRRDFSLSFEMIET